MIQFPEIPRQTAGRKDGQTLFHRTLLASAGGPTSTTAVDWHLKVKDIRYDAGLTKNYCITVSMHKISSIHKVIFKIQQILASNGRSERAHQKIIEITFSFLECAPEKLRYSRIKSPVTNLAPPVFDPANRNFF